MPSSEPEISESPFEAQLQDIEDALDYQLGARYGANLATNVKALDRLFAMNKFELECFLSRGGIIALNDQEHKRLRDKISDLILANRDSAEEVGLQLN